VIKCQPLTPTGLSDVDVNELCTTYGKHRQPRMNPRCCSQREVDGDDGAPLGGSLRPRPARNQAVLRSSRASVEARGPPLVFVDPQVLFTRSGELVGENPHVENGLGGTCARVLGGGPHQPRLPAHSST